MDFGEAIRPVFFQTDHEEFMYATHGGTAFVVKFRGHLYALTCGHVFKDFPHGALFIIDEKHATEGSLPAPIKGLRHPSAPRGDALGTDIIDVCVIAFEPDIAPDFFKGSEYPIDDNSVATATFGHNLVVAGVLKDKTSIDPPNITVGYCRLQLRDTGVSSDLTLRKAIAVFDRPEFDNITGVSGAPVFDQTAQKLCGMAVRGGMIGNQCNLHYVDIFDIVRLLEAVSKEAASTDYTKDFWLRKK
jgi:hypothetical protein